jgi:dolichyl-phosphate-mannose-protein mannosyltransferase
VQNLRPDDARWMQSLSLKPGWYYASAEIRTENVAANQTGATISIMEDGVSSPDIRGTVAWQQVGFYLKVGQMGADVDVALRVGGYGSLTTGTAYFRNARVIRVDGPPPGATPVYDLAAIRKASRPQPVGSPVTLIAVFVALGAVALYGWRLYGRALAEPTPAPAPHEPPREPPRERRRKKGRR